MLEWITKLDKEILYFIQEHLRIPLLEPVMIFITNLGNAGMIWIVISLILVFRKKTRKTGLLSLISLGLCFLVTNVALKNVIARMRPYDRFEDILILIERQKDFSFPSGHTASSFASAGIMMHYMSGKKKWLFITFAIMMGVSRLYVGVHYPTDVFIGALIGLGCSQVIWLGDQLLIKN